MTVLPTRAAVNQLPWISGSHSSRDRNPRMAAAAKGRFGPTA
jgi:hypothetical protein